MPGLKIRLNGNVTVEGHQQEGFLCMQLSLREPGPQEKSLNLQMIPLMSPLL